MISRFSGWVCPKNFKLRAIADEEACGNSMPALVHIRQKVCKGIGLLPFLIVSFDTIVIKPPYETTPGIISLVASISEKIGEINAAHLHKPPAELRRKNRIKTIQSSLQIEGNTLSLDQVTAILDNKRVIAPARDILEVKNAISVYERLEKFNPYSLRSLIKAHKILMKGLVKEPGKLRTGAVGIVKGKELTILRLPVKWFPAS